MPDGSVKQPAPSAGDRPSRGGATPSDLYVRFMAPVTPDSTAALLRIVDQSIQQGRQRIHILISSPGGSVFHGLSAYNYLRGAPIDVYTHNFGSVDSIGVIVYCAGSRRFCVPHARFLLHGVLFNSRDRVSLDEKQLGEHLKSLKIDQENIARVISDTTGKPLHVIEADMNERTTLSPTQARDYGLTHEVKSELFPSGVDMAVIQESRPPTGAAQRGPGPQQQSGTRSAALAVTTI